MNPIVRADVVTPVTSVPRASKTAASGSDGHGFDAVLCDAESVRRPPPDPPADRRAPATKSATTAPGAATRGRSATHASQAAAATRNGLRDADRASRGARPAAAAIGRSGQPADAPDTRAAAHKASADASGGPGTALQSNQAVPQDERETTLIEGAWMGSAGGTPEEQGRSSLGADRGDPQAGDGTPRGTTQPSAAVLAGASNEQAPAISSVNAVGRAQQVLSGTREPEAQLLQGAGAAGATTAGTRTQPTECGAAPTDLHGAASAIATETTNAAGSGVMQAAASRVVASVQSARAVARVDGSERTAAETVQQPGLPAPTPPAASGDPAVALTAALSPSATAVLRAFGAQRFHADLGSGDVAAPGALTNDLLNGYASAAVAAVAAGNPGGGGTSASTADRQMAHSSRLADAPAAAVAAFAVPFAPTGTSAPATAALLATPPAGSAATADPQLAGQVVKAISLAWHDGIGEARIRLTPENLGDVVVALKVERGQVIADLRAETPVARAWIESHQEELRQALADQGLDLGRFVVTSDGERQQPREEQGARQRRPAPRGQQGADGPRFEVTA
jgi:flagellar hook-length control protein FliK